LILSLKEQLVQARNGLLEGNALRHWLKRLQNEFFVRMAAIDAEAARATSEAEDAQGIDRDGSPDALTKITTPTD
jgi:DNA mismatch repair protein MSH4